MDNRGAGTLDPHLNSQVNWSRINELGNLIFKEGKFEKIDEILVLILPLLNITYYKYVSWLDDRHYAKDDLIQDALLEIYTDIKFRWDKYIIVDNYPKYFETIAKNIMVNLVHAHHNYYKTTELDPETQYERVSYNDSYELTEAKLLKDALLKGILDTTRRLANCRKNQSKILNRIITEVYVEGNAEALNLKSKLRVLGIDRAQFDFLYDHVLYLHRFSYNYHKSLIRGRENMRLRLEEVIGRYESSTYEILATNYGDSIIPELFAEFGPDVTKRIVRIFSNRNLRVPDYRNFCDDLLGGTVYSLAGGDKSNLYKIAVDNNLSYRTLSRMYDKVAKFKEGKQ